MVQSLQAAKDVARNPYAWPGGYPKYLITADGGCLCAKCTKSEFRQIASAAIRKDSNGWLPAATAINWEDTDLYCDHCNQPIEAAYAP